MPLCPHADEQSMRFANFFIRLPRAGVAPGVRRADFMQKRLMNEGASLVDFRNVSDFERVLERGLGSLTRKARYSVGQNPEVAHENVMPWPTSPPGAHLIGEDFMQRDL